jgi:hypothetical protein
VQPSSHYAEAKMLTARALVLAVLALVVLAPIVPAAAARLPTTDLTFDRKTKTQKEREKQNKPLSEQKDTKAKQKKEDTEVTVGRGTLDPIGTLARGQTVESRGTALRTGELCALQMFYSDKPATVIKEVVPDEKKRCVFAVPVPDRPGAVGEGKAKLILTKATSGKKSGEARQVFSVS